MIVADSRGRYQFRHALLREVVHDDLLPGEHAELHLALARALESQVAETGEDAIITAGIAHHYLSAGCQREALVASVRAADAAERVHAHGEAGALLERALDLWSRVPDAMEQVGCDRIELVRRAGRALINDGAHGRAEALLRQALGERRRAASEPRLAADLLELLSRAQWSLGRAEDARDSIARAVALLPEDDGSPERARILSRQAKIAMLQGRFSEVLPAARAALDAAIQARRDRPARRRAQRHGPRARHARRRRGGAAPACARRSRSRPSASSGPARGPTWPTRCTWSGARTRRSPRRSRAWPTPPARAAGATG